MDLDTAFMLELLRIFFLVFFFKEKGFLYFTLLSCFQN